MLETDAKRIAERLTIAMKQEGISNAELAEATHVSEQAVGQWLKTGTIARDKIHLIVKKIKRSADYLLGIEPWRAGHHIGEPLVAYGGMALETITEWDDPSDLPEGRYVTLACKQAHLNESHKLVFLESSIMPLIFTTNWIKGSGLYRHNLVIMEAVGDGMEPQIHEGDVLLIDRAQAEVQDGKTYALRYGSKLRVNRLLRRYDGAMILQSHNQMYRDEIIPIEALQSQVEIIGRIVWAGGEVN